jgi:hypothetical protein
MLPFETGHYLRNLKSKASYQNAKFFATKGSVLIINTAKKELNTNKWKKLISIVMVEKIREGRDFKAFDKRFYISSCRAAFKC